MTRTFTRKQKNAASLVAGREGHADHIRPYSAGGLTTLENCQIISPRANRKKSAFSFEPRAWQTEFLGAWDRRQPDKPFMLIAVPGGGKTMASLEVCRRWMAAGADRRIIVVVPTNSLQEQWRDEAFQFGIELQTKELGTNFKDGFQGAVATYHLVASQPLTFRRLCAVAPTMVVFDEVHHCQDDKHFGIGISNAFGLSKEQLLLSGTPWNSDGKPIPFVEYNELGFAVGNFSYDYVRALREGVIRSTVFDYAKGAIDRASGKLEELNQYTKKSQAQKRLGKILDPRGEYVRKQIRDANAKLVEVRKTTPDAGALAACIDQSHAQQVARVIREETGCEPSLIVSDSSMENDTVKKFRKSKKEWLVAVRKVSEGVDIKRLQVLCYLTNVATELFFRQLIGRVQRVRETQSSQEAYVYLPADPRLIEHAETIDRYQAQALRTEDDEPPKDRTPGDDFLGDYDPYTTIHSGTDMAFIGNQRVRQDWYEFAQRHADTVGMNLHQAWNSINALNGLYGYDFSEPPPCVSPMEVVCPSSESQPMEERMKALRGEINKKVNKIVSHNCKKGVAEQNDFGKECKRIHKLFKRQKEMTEQELQDKLETLEQRGLTL